jgi:PAS domain S-box-containing protein
MSKKPTYEELEKRVKELEKEAIERKQAEESLGVEREFTTPLIDNAPIFFVAIDARGKTMMMNQRMLKVLGYTANEVVGKDYLSNFVPEKERDMLASVFRKLTAEHEHTFNENHILSKDGKEFLVEWHGTPVFDTSSKLQYFYGLGINITERKLAEETLRESEEKFRSIFHAERDAIMAFDAETLRFFEANDATLDLYGYTQEEYLKLTPVDISAEPEDTYKAVKKLADHLSSGEVASFVRNHKKKDGTVFSAEISSSTFILNGRKMICGIVRDITDRKKAEAALKEAYDIICKSPAVAFLWKNEESWPVEFVTDNVEALFGYTTDEFLSRKIAYDNVVYPDDLERVAIEVATFSEEPGRERFAHHPYRILTKKGQVKWVEDRTFIRRDEKGHITHYQGIVEDITERKQAEEALRESEEKFRLVTETINDVFWMSTCGIGEMIYIGPAYETLWERSRESLLQSPKSFLEAIHPDDLDEYLEVVNKYHMNGKPYECDYRIIRRDGEIRWINEKGYSVLDSVGGAQLMSGVCSDITERKQLEEQLRQSHKMEAIGTLAGGIAHDFNNILGIILGYAELGLDDVPEENPAHLYLEEIRIASFRAKAVVRQLFSFARETTLEKKPTNIIPIVKESLKFLRSSIPTSIEIRQNISKNVDTIIADPTQINQVLINLCTNADHAMTDGGIVEISLKNVELGEDTTAQHSNLNPGQYVNLAVSDTGHGMPPEEIDRIFDPYFTTKEVGNGSGMGLAVVHGIVMNHDGAIFVDSELGKGTTFNIFFPITEKEPLSKIQIDEDLPTGKERILFIDDEETMVNVGRNRLERLGYQVETKTSPVEALELFRANPNQFDLVITDMTMPQLTGDHLVEEILKIRPDIPIILCTGFSEKIDEIKAKAIGAADYIEKPIDKRDFAFKVRKVLDGK